MAKGKSSLVFLDVSIDGDPYEKLVFEVCSSLNSTFMYPIIYLQLVNITVFIVCLCSFCNVSFSPLLITSFLEQLFFDVAPKTAENFRALCTGKRYILINLVYLSLFFMILSF